MSCTTVWHDFIIDNESIRYSLLQMFKYFLRQKYVLSYIIFHLFFDSDKRCQIYGKISWAF